MIDRFVRAARGFELVLREVEAAQWDWPTPCTEWTVRQLVNHMARGNLNYAGLAAGGTATEFLRLRDADALGADPVAGYLDSVATCARAFADPVVSQRILDYPLGRVPGRQALAVRTTDSVVHTWDLARAIGADDTLDPDLVTWITSEFDAIYAGLAETPTDPTTTHRFFAPPVGASGRGRQERLLHRLGRVADWCSPMTRVIRQADK